MRGAWAGPVELRVAAWGFAVNAAWEFLQSPLYADHARGPVYLLRTRLHCALGDVLLLLVAFWITAALCRSRNWWRAPTWPARLAFSGVTLGYTAWSEWWNTQVRLAWEYAPAMPLVFGLGVAPLLQWLVAPVAVLALLRASLVKGEGHEPRESPSS